MSFIDKNIGHNNDLLRFLKSFPDIGGFKIYHDKEEAYVDDNFTSLVRFEGTEVTKSQLFAFLESLKEKPADGEKDIYHYVADGEMIYLNLRIASYDDCLIGFVQDVTRWMDFKNGKEDSKTVDPLTGLYTRNHFIRRVRSMLSDISGTAQCCMAVAHIDGIESIDSELNYDKTALCIASAAGALRKFASDDIVIGVKSYKDFYIFFRQMAKTEVSQIIRQMAQSVKNCRIVDQYGNEIQTRSGNFSLTVGYCWYPVQAMTMDMMMNYADFALFRAMANGNTDKEFDADEYAAEQTSYSDSKLLSELIDKNDFQYRFQPIVSASDGSIYGYEALMRAENSTPLDVLRIAREHGKLYEIEMLTFENVLAKVKENMAEFGDRKVFINSVPDYMLKEYDFYRLCAEYRDIMPQVVIELTEESDLTDENVSRLKELYRSMGCMIAIDDYGTGYSNSVAVVDLSPDIIKVDRSLISGINTNTRKQHFLSGIVEFAKLNGIKVLAEGVETNEEMTVVIRRGVDYIQGFFTARPSTEIVSYISSRISDSIKAVNMNKPVIKLPKVFNAGEAMGNVIDVGMLSDEKYTSVSINDGFTRFSSSNNALGDVTLKVADNTEAYIVLDGVHLQGSILPCVIIGEKSRVTLDIKGDNSMKYDGISIPDSSEVIITGNGTLYIDSYRNNGCCIGAPYNEPFGKITVNMDDEGVLRLCANGDHAICIGGGMTSQDNAIELLGGEISASCTGKECIGVGFYDDICDINIGNCKLGVFSSGDNSVCVGSLCGIPRISLDKSSATLEALGVNACCVGGLALVNEEEHVDISVANSRLDLTVKSQRGAALGCRKQYSGISLSENEIKLHCEGDIIAGIGSVEGGGKTEIFGCDISTECLAGPHSVCIGMQYGETSVRQTAVNSIVVNNDDFRLAMV